MRTKCNKRRIKGQKGVRPNWSLIQVEVEREREEEEEEGGEESKRKVWNLLSFV